MKRMVLFFAAAAAAIAVAVPAFGATNAAAVRAGGVVQAFGTTGPKAKFTLYLNSGFKHNMLTYTEPGTAFRALSFMNEVYGPNAAKFSGIGLVNGKYVHYTAIVVSHPTFAGVFKLAWSHAASRGGKLLNGNVQYVPGAAA